MQHEALADYPVVIAVPVLWGDQDAFGHVNNVVYLRWCETARVDYLGRIGLWQMIAEQGVGPIVASISCDYRKPINYPDEIHAGARVTRIGNSSFKMDHVVVSRETNAVVAQVSSTLVVYDYRANKPVPVPGHIRAAIAGLEGRSL